MGANRRVGDLSLRELHRDSGERVTKTQSAALYDRLKEALANFDLNELYDTYIPRQRLDNFTQESIKRSAIEAALRAILTDVNYWVVNEPPTFVNLTERIRRRVDAGGPPLDFHEAVETYQHAYALCEDGWQRLRAATAEDRDHEIALSLWCLKDCGLPVIWRSVPTGAHNRRRDDAGWEDEPHVCLTLAMASATGIPESRIARAWRKFGNLY